MSFKVVNTFPFPDVDFGESLLEQFDATMKTIMCRTEDEIIKNTANADAIICAATFQPFNRHVIGSLSNCRIIANCGIGFHMADLDAATEYQIVVTNTPDYCMDEVSGRALAFMLALGHKLFQLDKAVRERQVSFILDRSALMEIAHPIYRMRDQTLGIVGLGRIGTATALKAKGLGMGVIAYDPYVPEGVMESRWVKPVDFETLLRESDYISIHTPLTEETDKMFSNKEFNKMKPNCHFINTARGGCVDQNALIRALEGGTIAGAGMDVTADEPVSADNPLLKMTNVILTGHSAGYSTTAEPELFIKPMTQVVKALKGEWPIYAVNPEAKKKWLERWGKKG